MSKKSRVGWSGLIFNFQNYEDESYITFACLCDKEIRKKCLKTTGHSLTNGRKSMYHRFQNICRHYKDMLGAATKIKINVRTYPFEKKI